MKAALIGLVVMVVAVAGCGTPGELVCELDEQCGGGLCIDGSCAFDDGSCLSGLRFHESAGARANECVDIGVVFSGDTPADPIPLPDGAMTVDVSNKHDDFSPSCAGPGGKDVFFEVQLDDFERLYLDTVGTNFAVTLTVRQGRCADLGSELSCGVGNCGPNVVQYTDTLDAGTYCVIADQLSGSESGTMLTVRASMGPPADLTHPGPNFGDTCDSDDWDGTCASGTTLPDQTWFLMTCIPTRVHASVCATDSGFDGHIMTFGLDGSEQSCASGCDGGVIDLQQPGGVWVVAEAGSEATCDLIEIDFGP